MKFQYNCHYGHDTASVEGFSIPKNREEKVARALAYFVSYIIDGGTPSYTWKHEGELSRDMLIRVLASINMRIRK